MSASLRSSADGSQVILGLNGADKVVIGSQGIEPGSFKPGAIAPADLAQKATLGVSQVTTSGVAVDFTGVPSWVKKITVLLNGVSTNGTAAFVLQLGSGAVETSGYLGGIGVGSGGVGSNSASLIVSNNQVAAGLYYGVVTLTLMGNNTWVSSGLVTTPGSLPTSSNGAKTVSGTLDRIRLTTGNGTDAFDAGSVNILFE